MSLESQVSCELHWKIVSSTPFPYDNRLSFLTHLLCLLLELSYQLDPVYSPSISLPYLLSLFGVYSKHVYRTSIPCVLYSQLSAETPAEILVSMS